MSMTKFFFHIIIFSFLFHTVQAQSTKVYPSFYEVFTCKNANGSIETLLATFDNNGKRGFIYKNSKNPKNEIPLKIISNTDDEVFIIQFPNNSKNYTLKTCMACPEITCTNPDGTVQTFNLEYNTWGNRGTYRCINADKSIEYLRIEGSANNLVVKYCSNTKPKWITLNVSNIKVGEMDNLHFFDITFPNSKTNYRIEPYSTGYGYNCWLPNGGQQGFEWINK
jgi:hypothetical protein